MTKQQKIETKMFNLLREIDKKVESGKINEQEHNKQTKKVISKCLTKLLGGE